MSNYFSKVPDLEYVSRLPDSQIGSYIKVKNLFKGVRLREDILQDLTIFEKYQIIGDDRPDNVAFNVYGDSTLDWLVLKCNNIINIQTEWPMSQEDLDRHLLNKYETYDDLYNGIHHYETVEIKNSQGVVMVPEGMQVPSDWTYTFFDSAMGQHPSSLKEYNTIQNNPVISVTNYDYEIKIENKKRNIFLLKEGYVNLVKDDLNEEMQYKKGGTQYVSPTLKKAENIKLYQ
tara:strand:+ start:14542 stop:15234 length:693 start_codon:yes stop_codon:yes gene_type:complete